jgi:hypothetical protein
MKDTTLVRAHTIRVHKCTDARIPLEKSHFVPLFGLPSASPVQDIAVQKSFRHWEIEGNTYSEEPSKTDVARVLRKVSLGCRVMFTIAGSGSWEVMSGEEQLPVVSCLGTVVSCELLAGSGERAVTRTDRMTRCPCDEVW